MGYAAPPGWRKGVTVTTGAVVLVALNLWFVSEGIGTLLMRAVSLLAAAFALFLGIWLLTPPRAGAKPPNPGT